MADTVPNIAGIAAITGQSDGDVVYLTDTDRAGWFQFDDDDVSAAVSGGVAYGDTENGIYVLPSSDTSGSSGLWIRQYDGPINSLWFGSGENGIEAAIALAGTGNCARVVDTREITGTLSITKDLWAGVTDVTVLTGPATWEIDSDTVQQRPYHGCTIICADTVFQPDADDAEGTGPSVQGQGLFALHVEETTATTTSFPNEITVASTANLRPGGCVAVQGLLGANSNQRTTLSGALDASSTTISVAETTGFDNASDGVGTIMIGSEIITYTGVKSSPSHTFTGCVRGALGTTATSHSDGSNVDIVLDKVARIESIVGTTVTLDTMATESLTDARVRIGAKDVSFLGTADWRGRRGDDPNHALLGGVSMSVSAGCIIEKGHSFRSFNHFGVLIRASIDFNIEVGACADNFKPTPETGQDVFVFGQCRDGRLRTTSHNNTRVAVFLDDRSSSGGNSLIGENEAVAVDVGPADTESTTLAVHGARNCNIRAPYLKSDTGPAFQLLSGGPQWTTPTASENNSIDIGYAEGSPAVRVGDGTAGIRNVDDGNNIIVVGRAVGAVNPNDSVGNTIIVEGVTYGLLKEGFGGEVVISGGDVTVTHRVHIIDTEGNASTDVLDSISVAGDGPKSGMTVTFRQQANSRAVTYEHSATLVCKGSVDATPATNSETITFMYFADLARWQEIYRSF
ncbi:MAG: hypothetical protein ACTS1Z_03950 [Parasphingopyxis sp.]|uniref:hypothetical protein n=1 Tax=Parasphingopyxis sp. TaxID=1920299 RepID=UPI003FA07ECF